MKERINAVSFNGTFPLKINICVPEDKKRAYSRETRLRFYIEQINLIPTPTCADESLHLVQECMTHIEDLYSGIVEVKNPPLMYMGRMYPAQEDNIERRNDGGIIVRTKGNIIEIEANGSFEIKDRNTNEVWLKK